MSETLNETLPVVDVAGKTKWVNFGDGRTGEQIVDNNLPERNHKQSFEESSESKSNIHLPPPPRRHRSSDTDRHNDKSSRSSTPYLSNSPSSSTSKLNHQDKDRSTVRSTDRSTDRSSDRNRSNDKSTINHKSADRPNDCTLNIPETFIKSNSSNLQNVPLKDMTSPTNDAHSSSNTTPSSRFSK